VLALVSAPGYDPNDFILGISDKEWNKLQSSPDKPLLNRFTQAYAPGSSFKPITAAIALKTESIDPNKKVHISGPDWQPDDPSWGDYKVHRVDSLSEVNLQDALIYSDNIYFAQTALKIGADKFLNEAKNFGFGEKLPSFPIPIEPAQISNNGKIAGQVQLANSGYGQAQVATSALQLAVSYTPFVNDGNLLKPTIELENATNNADVWHKNVISPKLANTIENYLIQVVQNPHGTGHAANINGLTIAGKTGTAELKKSKEDKNGKENGWFVGFNTKNPKIMISMMIEDVKNRGGSHYVVPKVAAALKSYLKQ
jgi:penicillin-binding protein